MSPPRKTLPISATLPMSATLPLGSSPRVARFPLEFNNGAGCIGDAKGDPIGYKLTSHASSCKVCSGVFGVNPVDSLLSAFATDSLGGVVGDLFPRSGVPVG